MNETHELPAKIKLPTEYLVVTDRDSKVILSTLDRYEAVRLVNKIRAASGEVTVFKSTKL